MTEPAARAAARWVGGLFAITVLLQRFAVPGLPQVSLLVPGVLAWCAAGVAAGIVTLDRTRTALWLAAAGASGLIALAQNTLVRDAFISLTSWALLLTVWLPGVLRLRHASRAAYLAALRVVTVVAATLAAGCLAMTASQVAGLPYRDLLAAAVPADLLLRGFVITYPVAFESDLMRANAWIGLEPSVVSTQLGVGIIAALLVRARVAVVLLLLGGMLTTAAGSGFAIVAVGGLVLLVSRYGRPLLPHVLAAAAMGGAALATPWGSSIGSRLTEITRDHSSTSLRAALPYEYLWPIWTSDPSSVLLGRGPGSSQDLVSESGIVGLLVATPIKLFFDYGLIAGAVVAAFLLVCYSRGPSRSMAAALAVSLWALQPGSTTMVFVVLVFLFVTWWAPAAEPVLEARQTAQAPPILLPGPRSPADQPLLVRQSLA